MKMLLMLLKVEHFNSELFVPIIECEICHLLNKTKLNLSYFNNIANLNIFIQIVKNKTYKYSKNNNYYVDYYQRIILNIFQYY